MRCPCSITRMPRHGSAEVRALVVDHCGTLWGAERVVLELGPRVSEHGIDIRLAGPEGPLADAWRGAGLTHVPLDLPEHRGLRSPDGGREIGQIAREAVVVGRSAARIASLAADVDVLHSNHQWAHVETALAGKLARRPVILHVHDILPPGVGRRLLVAAARGSAKTLAACQAIADPLGDPAVSKVEVLYPALDLDRFAPGPADPEVRALLGGADGSPVVSIIGRLDPVKGIDILVRAVADLEPDLADTRVAVVGAAYGAPARYVADLRRQADDLLGDRVRFIDFHDDVPSVLRASDVLVNASRLEPFGTVVLEAQACGIPAIATTAGGVGEHIDHGENGWLVPPDDSAALAAVLSPLLREPALRAKAGSAARQMVEERFDIRDAAQRLAAIYRAATAATVAA